MQQQHINLAEISPAQKSDSALFERIAADITAKGFSINQACLSGGLADSLHRHALTMDNAKYRAAGVGRGESFLRSKFVRTDEICWITGDSEVGNQWLTWANSLRLELNRKLLLGLFSFESHFSHYGIGDYYKRHRDAFRGDANRVLSLVLYLNPAWTAADGGELVIYNDDEGIEVSKVTPLIGTLVVFLSEEFPHEVLAARRDRYAIAGWYRVNSSVSDRVDPPR